MDFLLTFLPIVIYILLIAILTIGIILGIKLIKTVDKVDKTVDNVNEKLESLDSMFNIIDIATDKIASFSDRLIDGVSSFISKLWFRKSKRNIEEEEEYE